MNMFRMGLLGALGVVTSAAWSLIAATPVQERVTPIPVQSAKESTGRQPVGPLMQAKLGHAQRVLEGLVTHDLDRIASAAAAMKLMSLDPPRDWKQSEGDNEVYEHFRMEFMRQSARLEKMAKEQNLAGAAYYQQNLTATCIACHDYIRDYESSR